MTTKLQQYNRSLAFLGTQLLHSTNGLTEDVKSRYELDRVYDDSIRYMLENGIWKFARRTVVLTPDTDVDTEFGAANAYSQPTDYVRLAGIFSDDRMRNEIRDFEESAGYWITDTNPIYIRYVSNGLNYGLNLGVWPINFCEAHACYLALQTGLPITRDKMTKNDLWKEFTGFRLQAARRLNAVDEPVRSKPTGSWISSRFRRRGATSGDTPDGSL